MPFTQDNRVIKIQIQNLGPNDLLLTAVTGQEAMSRPFSYRVEMLCEDDESRALSDTEFVVFDIETTGPKMPPSRVMEIGATRVSNGRIVAEFQTLVNPRAPIPPFIVGLTGISDAMVASAPTFEEVAADWLRFADTDRAARSRYLGLSAGGQLVAALSSHWAREEVDDGYVAV